MGNIIGDSACPKCRENGHDKNGDHLLHFDDGGKYCPKKQHHSDGKPYIVSPEGEYREEELDLTELKSNALLSRGIDKDVAEHFGVKVEYDCNREEVKYYYPEKVNGETIAHNVRELPKTFYNTGEKLKGKEVDLWGQTACGSGKKLLITEGKDDAMAAFQMLWRKYPNYKPAVVANSGVGTKRISNNLDFVLGFEEVIICLDPDEAGLDGAKKLAQLIGPSAKVMDIPLDPNDMLKKGKSKEFVKAFFEAKAYTPDGILTVDDVYQDAIKMPEWGRRWPWHSLNGLTYGRRNGEGIYVGAGVKAGKTEFLSQMVHYITEVENNKVMMFKFEQSPAHTVKALAGKVAHQNFMKPDGDFTELELQEAVEHVRGKAYIFDASYSDVGYTNMWDRIKPVIRHAVISFGIQDIFIDPITQLTDGLTPSDTETELRRFSNEIAGMANDLGFFYYCFCHLKEPPAQSKSHEEGGKVKVAQFRGSRAMAEKTKFMLGIERNQYADEIEDRNTSTFRLLLNSGFGRTGSFPVYYNEDTGDYLEVDSEY